ncbi:hypothetical protein D3C71_2191980 [compost metagenome]
MRAQFVEQVHLPGGRYVVAGIEGHGREEDHGAEGGADEAGKDEIGPRHAAWLQIPVVAMAAQ